VLEPSGAIGYGQDVSAVHVNDWGETTSREIIEGTRAFLSAHPYVDPKRVGAIGASYGGFMTNWLIARYADRFSNLIRIVILGWFYGEPVDDVACSRHPPCDNSCETLGRKSRN